MTATQSAHLRDAEPVLDRRILRHATARGRRATVGLSRRIVLTAGRRASGAAIEVIEGSERFRLGRGEPMATVTVHDRRTYDALLRSGSVGLGTSYVAGWWDADDLTALVRALVRHTRPLREHLDRLGRAFGAVLDVPARRATPGRNDDKRNIAEHYDLSNDFFALMLDGTMTYSCAVFEPPGATLAEAQRTKIDRLCKKLELVPTDHLVEIGSGWGGLAVHAATRYGCRVTTTTISDAQRTHVEKRVADAGLADRITVLGLDWRDLTGTFDKLVSVEMVEAVDWRWHDRFLAKCAQLVAEDGMAAIQAIVIDDRSFARAKRHQDFVRRMVFPGGCLPSVASLTTSVVRATDLRVVDLEDIGRHYPETLRHWADNLAGRADSLAALGVGEGFRRLWDLYLAYCEASFLEGHISDVQLVLARSGPAGRLSARPG
ncbi:MAG TPA: cyclopropane-fatty-acyl-phospholipid synthase family protein [Acidimicrobiales bacterium]|nr:cyclopropane-fatty-acyl-phospholipid synthase family protein [Acidimicrobiales bacterium]